MIGREVRTCSTQQEQKQKQTQTHEQCVALGLACAGVLERREKRSCAVVTCVDDLSKEEGFGKARVLAPVPSEDLREGSRFALGSPSQCSCLGRGSLMFGGLVLSMYCFAVGKLGSSLNMCGEASLSCCAADMFCGTVNMCSASLILLLKSGASRRKPKKGTPSAVSSWWTGPRLLSLKDSPLEIQL